jgi:hypothetical protein
LSYYSAVPKSLMDYSPWSISRILCTCYHHFLVEIRPFFLKLYASMYWTTTVYILCYLYERTAHRKALKRQFEYIFIKKYSIWAFLMCGYYMSIYNIRMQYELTIAILYLHQGKSHCKLIASSAKCTYLINVGRESMLQMCLNLITFSVKDQFVQFELTSSIHQDWSPTCPMVWNTDANIVTLGTAAPAPADAGLNLDNKG